MVWILLEQPRFTNRPVTLVTPVQGTIATLCCAASGSPRPKVDWSRAQKSSVSFPVSQEAGCLVVNTAEENTEGELPTGKNVGEHQRMVGPVLPSTHCATVKGPQ